MKGLEEVKFTVHLWASGGDFFALWASAISSWAAAKFAVARPNGRVAAYKIARQSGNDARTRRHRGKRWVFGFVLNVWFYLAGLP